MLVIRENYNNKISPFGYDYVENIILPVEVKISITIMDILSIQEVNLVYVLKFRFLMEWYDYRWGLNLISNKNIIFLFNRLKYHNLKTERSNNLLSRSEIDNLWIPFVVFSNTENSEATKGDDDTEVTVTKEGTFTESPLEVMEEINIFEGSDNKITFQQVYAKEFKCVYQLQLYPFDTQERKFACIEVKTSLNYI